MQDLDDIALLRAYAVENSERAFEVLVTRHLALVYSAALRQVNDPQAAQEIAQTTFLILARKAGSLRAGTVLPGWLFKTVRYVAATEIRTARRRQHYEREAHMESTIQTADEGHSEWEQIAPLLDEAVAHLGEKDRNIVVLRFLQQKTLKEVGDVLGIDTKAAQKRAERAVDRLRHYFARRGVVLSAAALIAGLSAGAAQAAPPAGLAATLAAGAAFKGTAAAASATPLLHATLKFMAWLKIQTALIVGAAVLVAAGGAVVAVKEVDLHSRAPEPAYKGKTVTAWFQYIRLAIDHRSQKEVYEGVDALQKMGAPAAPYVLRELEQAYPAPGYKKTPERTVSELMLGAVITNVPDAVALLTNSHANIRAATASVLVDMDMDEDNPVTFPKEAIPSLVAMINGDDPQCRISASALIASYGPEARAAVPGLIKALQDVSPTSRINAAESDLMNFRRSFMNTLSRIGPDAAPAIPVLKTFHADASPGTRLDAAIAIWKIGHDSTEVLPEVLDYFSNDTNVLHSGGIYLGLSWTAIDTLGEIGPPARAAVPKLSQVISTANLSKAKPFQNIYVVRAAVALWRIDRQLTNTLPILLGGMTNNLTGMHSAYNPLVLAALGEIGPPANAVVPNLVRELSTNSALLPEERAVLNDTLKKIDPEAAAKVVSSPPSSTNR